MEFEVQVRLGKQDLVALDRLVGKTYRRWSTLAARTVLLVFGGCIVLLCLLLVIGGGLSEGLGGFTLIAFLLGLFPLLYGSFYHQIGAARRRCRMVDVGAPAVLHFGETFFEETSARHTGRQPYTALDRLYAYHGRCYLFLDRNHCFVVPMDGFTKGASADFARFIQERTGKPLASIPGRTALQRVEAPVPRVTTPAVVSSGDAVQPEEETVRHRFDLPEGYAFRDLVLLNRAVVWVNRQWGSLILRLLLCGFGLVQIAASLALLRAEDFTPDHWNVLVFPMVLGTLILLLGVGITWLSALVSRRLMVKNVGSIAITLTDRSFREETRKGSTQYPYTAFTAVARSGGDYLIFLDKRHAYILPERSRSGGNLETFQHFLEEKTGLVVRVLKK